MRRTKEQYIAEIKGILKRYDVNITDVDIKEMGFDVPIINVKDNVIEEFDFADEENIYTRIDNVSNGTTIQWEDLTDTQAFILFNIVDMFRRELIKQEHLN